MKKRFSLWAASLVGVCALALSSCIQFEEKVILNADNSGKTQVSLEMPNPMAMMGDLGAAAGDDAPKPEDMAKDMAQGILGSAEGVDAWSNVEWGVTEAGKMSFKGVAYFKDFTKFKAGSNASGGGGGGEMGGEFKSEINADGMWVISMDMSGGDDGEAKGEPVAADKIDETIAQSRQQWQAMKGMMGGFFADMKFEYRLKVAGEIQSVSNFEKHADNVAGTVIDGQKILAGMEKFYLDDDMMKAALAAGNVDAQGMPQPPDDVAGELIFGEDGPVEIVIKPGEPLFDYAAQVAEAQANMSDELKQMIEDGKAAAAAGGDADLSF